MRRIVIAGNWKMYKTQAEASEFLPKFMSELETTSENREVILCVPFTLLNWMSKTLHGSRIQ
ncbi:triose-phosphate isomerase, partial [Merismopedia glauca]